jgi:hypothetical protein
VADPTCGCADIVFIINTIGSAGDALEAEGSPLTSPFSLPHPAAVFANFSRP